ncbi:MAG: 30S ribosomal protein S1, partial [Acidimicrobiales bacterium]
PEAHEPEAHEPEAHEPAAVGEAATAGASPEGEPSPEPAAAATVQGFEGGQVLTGAVLSVDENEIVVALADDKRGVIGRRHYSNDPKVSLPEQVKPGDPIEGAVLVREDREDRIVLSRTWALKQDAWRRIEEARAAGAPVSGRVTEVVKGGLVLDLGVRAFMPASQVELHHVDNLGAYLGQTIEALVAEIDRDADKAVLSRRQLLRRQEKVKANEFLATLAPGQVHRGKVATLADFGAFVEFGGVRGLLHLSEMSWQRVERADDVVRLGQEISFKILSIKNNGKRISLSMRALSGDPLQGLQVGAVLSGVVTRLVDFGAFVRIGEGVEGLVHLSELAEYRVSLPEEVVAPGDEVLVKIINIDRKRRRVDLSINQAVQYS